MRTIAADRGLRMISVESDCTENAAHEKPAVLRRARTGVNFIVSTGRRDEHRLLVRVLLDSPNGLARLAALPFRWLLVVAVALHVARKALALAKALEALQHLLDGLIASWSDLDQNELLDTLCGTNLVWYLSCPVSGRLGPRRARFLPIWVTGLREPWPAGRDDTHRPTAVPAPPAGGSRRRKGQHLKPLDRRWLGAIFGNPTWKNLWSRPPQSGGERPGLTIWTVDVGHSARGSWRSCDSVNRQLETATDRQWIVR